MSPPVAVAQHPCREPHPSGCLHSANPLAELLPSFPNGMGNAQEMIELYN